MSILKKISEWRKDKQISQEYEENWLPPWAIGRTEGLYTDIHAMLPTKDGTRVGNAVSLGTVERHETLFIKIVTDAGTILFLTQSEAEDLFHAPQYIMNILLPAHKQAIMDEQKNPEFRGVPDYKVGISTESGDPLVFAFHTHEEREAFSFGIKMAIQLSGGATTAQHLDGDEANDFDEKATDYKKRLM